jgi:hypothetical protein
LHVILLGSPKATLQDRHGFDHAPAQEFFDEQV